MYATVVSEDGDNYELAKGDRIEVVGFVDALDGLRAVWRDNEGYVWSISTRHIRMLPNTSDSVLISEADFQTLAKARP